MAELKALIFDVDGTLADTERYAHLVAFNQAFEEHQLDWHWSEELYGDLLKVTGGKERMNYYLDTYRPDYQRPANLQDFIATLHKAKTKHYNELVATGKIPLRPGVKRLIQEAREAGIRLAIATTTTFENVTTLLKTSLAPDSVDWFEVIGAGNVVPEKKPAADIYHYILKEMNLPAENCIAFEDSNNGIRASLGANLRTLITINGYTQDHDFTGAALVVDQLGEPDQPFKIIAGKASDASYANIDLVKRLMQ